MSKLSAVCYVLAFLMFVKVLIDAASGEFSCVHLVGACCWSYLGAWFK